MASRLLLHPILVATGVKKVYFQAPSNVAMEYPCIVYGVDDVDTKYADNLPYDHIRRYQVTLIDTNPDSEYESKIAALPMSSFNRRFVADKLNHIIYNIYF